MSELYTRELNHNVNSSDESNYCTRRKESSEESFLKKRKHRKRQLWVSRSEGTTLEGEFTCEFTRSIEIAGQSRMGHSLQAWPTDVPIKSRNSSHALARRRRRRRRRDLRRRTRGSRACQRGRREHRHRSSHRNPLSGHRSSHSGDTRMELRCVG